MTRGIHHRPWHGDIPDGRGYRFDVSVEYGLAFITVWPFNDRSRELAEGAAFVAQGEKGVVAGAHFWNGRSAAAGRAADPITATASARRYLKACGCIAGEREGALSGIHDAITRWICAWRARRRFLGR